jgi:3-deoxy-7-phosphoheptulonate synthase
MAYTIIKKLPAVDEIIQQIPVTKKDHQSIEKHRQEIQDILSGKDKRLLIIVGPCSAWPEPAVLEYAKRLVVLNDKVKHALKLVMRVYIQKPRTVKGWTGPVNQPDPLSPPDIEAGIRYSRSLMAKVVQMGLPIADEALFTHNARGFLELLSWVAIGARSSEDQEHRIFASLIDCPVGMKNPTHGSLKIAINGIIAAQHQHTVVLDGYEVNTSGNPYAHLVLRGGNGEPNYAIQYLEEANKHFIQGQVENPAIIIDASHDNCLVNGKKDYTIQGSVANQVLDSVTNRPDLAHLVKGFMLESFLKDGNQNVEQVTNIDMNGLSITDPCLGFTATEEILINLANKLALAYK